MWRRADQPDARRDAVPTSSGSTRPATSSASPSSVAAVRSTPVPRPPGCRSRTRSFDGVVACLVFEHIDDVDGAIAEVARVLRRGGRFAFFLNHPLLQTPGSGWIDDQVLDPPEQYWRIGPYLDEAETDEQVELGVYIRFLHRPLSRYLNTLDRPRARARADDRTGASTGVPRAGTRIRAGGDHPAPAVPPSAARRPSVDSRRWRRSCSSPGFPGRAGRRPRRCSRTSGSTSSTTCRRRCWRRSSSWRRSPVGGIDRLALVSGRQHADVLPHVGAMRAAGHRVTIVYLDASTSELVRRYDATRRKHPLADEADGLLESIELERQRLSRLRDSVDLVIDTTDLNVHQLKDRLVGAFETRGTARLQVAIESFGYKHGLPLDADIVMDVRFLPNPHWDDELRPLTGFDQAIRDYVLETAAGRRSSTASTTCSPACSPRTRPRAGATSRLPSGARAGAIDRSRSPRSWRGGSATAASPCARRTATSPSPADGPAASSARSSASQVLSGRRGAGARVTARFSLPGDGFTIGVELDAVVTIRRPFVERTSRDMTVRVGINGFGRIGRSFFRARSNAAPTSTSSPSTTSARSKRWRTSSSTTRCSVSCPGR